MAWSAPMTAVANTAFTAAQFNQYVRDNLNETGPAKVTTDGQYLVSTGANTLAARNAQRGTVVTSESTASTSFVDLATSGPAATVTTGDIAFVMLFGKLSHGTALGNAIMSYAISGATTQAALDETAMGHAPSGANGYIQASIVFLEVGLTPGSNVFTAKYKTNTGTATFALRRTMVLPF
jgi:hypothetical protein